MSRDELDPLPDWPYTPRRIPAPPRCANCGQEWPKAGTVCDQKCAASHAATLAAYATGSCANEERDAAERVEAAMTKAAEHAAAVRRWAYGRD